MNDIVCSCLALVMCLHRALCCCYCWSLW